MNTVQALVGAALAATLASLAGVYMYRSSEFLGQTMSFSFVFSVRSRPSRSHSSRSLTRARSLALSRRPRVPALSCGP